MEVNNIQTDRFFRQLAKKYDLNLHQVRHICTYPFLFTKNKMNDRFDTNDILFYKLGRFKIRPMFKENKALTMKQAKKLKTKEGKEKYELWKKDPEKYRELYGDWWN